MSEIEELRKQRDVEKHHYKQLADIARVRREALEAAKAKIRELEQEERRELGELRKQVAALQERNEKLLEQANAYDAEVLRLQGVAASQYKCTEVRAAEARRWETRSNFFIDGMREEVDRHVARAAQLRAVHVDLDGYPEALIHLEALAGVHQNVARDLTAIMAAANETWAESAIKNPPKPTEAEEADDRGPCKQCGGIVDGDGRALCDRCIQANEDPEGG